MQTLSLRHIVERSIPAALKPALIVPTTTQMLDAAESLLAQSGHRTTLITVEELREQLSLDRGVRYDSGALEEAAYSLFDTTPDDIGTYVVSEGWLRRFRSFLATSPSVHAAL